MCESGGDATADAVLGDVVRVCNLYWRLREEGGKGIAEVFSDLVRFRGIDSSEDPVTAEVWSKDAWCWGNGLG